MKKLDTFQLWALITTAATYALIAIGGLVRAAGAGLGCPDWPKCYGQWIPPTHVSQLTAGQDPATFNVFKTWLEYVNRMIGVAIGLLIFTTLVLAILKYRKVGRVLWPTVASFILVGFEGWLGGQVVLRGLEPWILSAHLAVALVIVSLLLYATVCAFFEGGRPIAGLPAFRRRLATFSLVASGGVLLQTVLGALIRGHIQEAAKTGLPRAEWITAAGSVYGWHRAFAVLVTIGVLALCWYVMEHGRAPWLRRSAIATAVLCVAQPLTGLGMARWALPPSLQVLHLWLGALVLGGLTVLFLLSGRLAVEAAPPEAHSASLGARA